MSGNNFVVHTNNWFYASQGKINIWNLNKIIQQKAEEKPKEISDPLFRSTMAFIWNPVSDFEFKVDADDMDNSYAIISDTGIMTRNINTFDFDYFHDFWISQNI